MVNRFNQRNIRNAGTGSAYDPDQIADRIADGYGDVTPDDTPSARLYDRADRAQTRQKSTADEVSEGLSRVRKALEHVPAALAGDDEAGDRITEICNGDDGDDAVEKGDTAGRDGGLYAGLDFGIDDSPSPVRKGGESYAGAFDDVEKSTDAPDRHSETNTRTDDDRVAGNPRLRRVDDGD